MNYSRIKSELEFKEMTIKDLCYQIDVTEQGLHQMIRKKSMKIEILERISHVLELPVTYWFEEATSASNHPATNIDNGNDATVKKRKRKKSKPILERIDSLTKDLNEMLKELVSG